MSVVRRRGPQGLAHEPWPQVPGSLVDGDEDTRGGLARHGDGVGTAIDPAGRPEGDRVRGGVDLSCDGRKLTARDVVGPSRHPSHARVRRARGVRRERHMGLCQRLPGNTTQQGAESTRVDRRRRNAVAGSVRPSGFGVVSSPWCACLPGWQGLARHLAVVGVMVVGRRVVERPRHRYGRLTHRLCHARNSAPSIKLMILGMGYDVSGRIAGSGDGGAENDEGHRGLAWEWFPS